MNNLSIREGYGTGPAIGLPEKPLIENSQPGPAPLLHFSQYPHRSTRRALITCIMFRVLQNQDGERLSVAAIVLIVLATVALFAVVMLYLCSIVRSRHRRNKDEDQTKDVVIELVDETADEEMSTLEPIDLFSCASEYSVKEKKHMLAAESTLPDPSDLGRVHHCLDVHHCTSACCDVCRLDITYPRFLALDRQEESKRPDGVEERSVESVKLHVDVEADIDLDIGTRDKSTCKGDDPIIGDKEELRS